MIVTILLVLVGAGLFLYLVDELTLRSVYGSVIKKQDAVGYIAEIEQEPASRIGDNMFYLFTSNTCGFVARTRGMMGRWYKNDIGLFSLKDSRKIDAIYKQKTSK